VTRIESRTLKLHKERLNLSELVGDIVKDFVYGITTESLGMVRIEESLAGEVFVNADRARLTQVVIT